MPVLTHEVIGPASGPTVLLSSGLGGAAAFWRPQLDALLGAGWRVITYDQRGTGRSGGTLPEPYRIAHMAQDVLELLDATATPSCHLVGHALGGLVGLQLALDAPARVASLGLVNAWSLPNPHSARCFEARLALLAAGGARAYCEAQPIFLYPAAWCAEHPERVQAEVEHAIAHFPGETVMRQRIAALRAFDCDAALPGLDIPVWVSAAQDDTLVPWTCSRHLADRLPRVQLHTLPHGGHAHSVTQAEAFNTALLAFLAQHARTAH
ncbi:aminoacrylate hydrolase [Hylemonella gracilis str. Niagara R]|uniref:Putative carbamate hydrolase RutD n=1 Tax=Hylemonella gracilis str. Niagara R TaxID=1458275 RepID=A0A016XEM0_9BURK|nr:pyrimidine utilization protein D [Hylemonella gracilis]EYC50281.1 aminoacrylate hydrolase [Hylemonella gracilis str. Niagara R]